MPKSMFVCAVLTIFALAACDSGERESTASPSAPAGQTGKPKPGSDSRIAATAEQVAKEARGKVKCPAKIKSPPRPANAPVIDVVGVYPGMAFDDAANIVLCTNELLIVQPDTSMRFNIDTYGQTLRQGFSAVFAKEKINKTSQEILKEMQNRTVSSGGNSRVRDIEPGQAKWYVGTMGMPGEEKVYSAAREEWFLEGQQPTSASIEAALLAKYGTPTENRDGGGVQRFMRWAYDPMGRLVTESSPLFSGCGSVYDPDGAVSLIPDCGLVVSANIVNLRVNPELAEYIQVGVLASSDGYQAIQDVQQGLQAMENQRRAEQVKEATKNATGPQL